MNFKGLQCLTSEEANYMVAQMKSSADVKWDNSRLKFDQSNTENWYALSLPLFSRDDTKAVITIRELCPGLCGYGWIVCLDKVNGTWASERGRVWVH